MVDGQTLLMAIGGVGVAIGSFYGGRRSAVAENSSIASDTVSMLMAQIEALKECNADLTGRLATQEQRTQTLESLVTQKAEVAEVLAAVHRIETRLEAP